LMRLGPPDLTLFGSPSSCEILTTTSPGLAAAFIKYSRHNNGKLIKPYVIVEGIEMESYVKGNSTLVLGDHLGFGTLSWKQISSGEYGPGRQHLSGLTDFVDSLDKIGYDVVFVDFITNRATIQSNAKALSYIINRLNISLTQNGSTEHIELVGASMGGLIARVALREMELNGCCHNVKVFTTFSTPHLGANFPLAFQEGMRDMLDRSNLLNILGDMKLQYELILNSPAARQMLISHVETSAMTDRLMFSSYLDLIGHPIEARKNAVTNGSITGLHQRSSFDLSSPVITPGSRLFLFTLEAWVPTTFPIPLNQRSYRNAGTNGMYLVRSEGFVLPHSPTAPSNQLYYKGGKSLIINTAEVLSSYIQYSVAAYKFYLKSVAIASAAIANPPAAPSILLIGGLKLAIFSANVTTGLQAIFHSNISTNQTGVLLKHANFTTLGLDYAPGDNAGFVNESDVKFFTSRLYLKSHTFVPTVSSIDYDVDLFTNLISNQMPDFDIFSSFEGIISGYLGPDIISNNSQHVQMHPFLLEPVYLNFKTNKSSSIASNRTMLVNTVIGKPILPRPENKILNSDVEIYNWTISNNAKLSVNSFFEFNLCIYWSRCAFKCYSSAELTLYYKNHHLRLRLCSCECAKWWYFRIR